MAQGQVKKSAKPASKRIVQTGPKRLGNRVVKPKKANLVQKQKILKKHTSGLTAMTEKNLASKAGHLEMLKGGKKDNKFGAKKGK